MKRFLAALQAGIILFAMATTGTGHAAEGTLALGGATADEAAGEMTGAYYMRATLVPREDDLALIQRKPALYLASFNDGMATVAYSLENGRIVYRVVDGEIGDAAKGAIDRALVRLQCRIT
ncbi:hypothetical protein [Novosphingobium resinovorum]|uniref:hypothetical protein n=1 Tax=Novosphingobium resinovorum TaxID=158500 RepID=UPI002ED64BA3|nr:hypothetical protein [Novosphingobium resinovorum]